MTGEPMDKATRYEWHRASAAIYRVLDQRDRIQANMFDAFGWSTESRAKGLLGDVEAGRLPIREALALAYARGPSRGGETPYFRVLYLKSLRLGYAMATGNWSSVPESEDRWLRSRSVRLFERPTLPQEVREAEEGTGVRPTGDPVAGRPTRSVAAGGEGGEGARAASDRVEFAFPYRARGGARDANACARGVGIAVLEEVATVDAPVAYSLPVEPDYAGSMERLEVRVVDGVPYRPVLAPGAWEPMRAADFAGACAGGEPWVDHPFVATSARSPLAVDEYAFGSFARPGDDDAREEALAACLRRAGRLLTIGGIVHRPTTEPTLHLVARSTLFADPPRRVDAAAARRNLQVAWRVGDLAKDASQGPFLDVRVPTFDWLGDVFENGPYWSSFPTAALSFAADEWAAAEDVGRACSTHRMPYVETAPVTVNGRADTDAAEAARARLAAAACAFDDVAEAGLSSGAATARAGEPDVAVPDGQGANGKALGAFTRGLATSLRRALDGGYDTQADAEAELLAAYAP